VSMLPLRAVMAALALGLALCAAPVRAAEPLLTILFTGNTYGNYEPCPS
jgi:hypothetical protein